MNLPNKLTVLRIFFALICVAAILIGNFFSLLTGFLFFILASLTDYYDGYLARKYNLVSDLGKLLDPIADKILILGVFSAFLELGIISVWMLVAIMLREFIITGMRFLALSRGLVLEAKSFGKHKTVSQIAGIVVIFLVLIFSLVAPGNRAVVFMARSGVAWLMWYVVAITVFSGVYYLWANRKLIRSF